RALRLSERALHPPKALVGACNVGGVEVGARSKDELAIEARITGDGVAIDRDRTLLHVHEALEADIANDALRTVREGLLQLREDRLARRSVLPRLERVPADHIATAFGDDLLYIEVLGHLLVAAGAREDLLLDLLLLTHLAAEDEVERRLLVPLEQR